MDSHPIISIITVTYNAAQVIKKTLESIKSQNFTDFEYLVVDGDSKDNTLKTVTMANIPNSIIISEKDNGLYDAMNKGLRMAKGKYVLFLNAGDAFHSKDTLEHYAKEAFDNKDIIYGDTSIVDLSGNKISDRHLSSPEKLTKKSFADGMLICHQAFMIKKELAPQFNLKYKFSADYDWCVKCISNSNPNNCTNLNKITIDYLSDGLTDNNKWKSLRERFLIMTKHYGLMTTTIKHLSFILRAIKRGKL